jgi:putative MATE family efflux protein
MMRKNTIVILTRSVKPRRDLTQGAVLPHIARMSLPILIGMTAQMLLNIIDGIYVGRLGVESSVAVLNYGFPVFYLLFAFFNGLSIGTNSVLARYIGGKQEARAENALGQILWISMGLFLVLSLLLTVGLPFYLDFQKASPVTNRLAHQFLFFLLLGMPFTLITLSLGGGGLRAEGNMRAMASAQMLAVLSNILIAPFLVFGNFHAFGLSLRGLDLGVRGAGLASTVANILATIYIVRLYTGRKTLLRWILVPKWDSLEEVKGIFKVGVPSSVSQILIGLNWIIMTRMAADFGEGAVAAIGIGGRLDLLSVFPALAIMTSVLTLVGQNFGARRFDRVREAVRVGLLTAFLSLTAVSLLVFTFRHPIIGVFRQEPRVHDAALHYVSFQCLGYGLVGINIVCSGAFQGLGRGLPFLFLTTLRLLIVALPAAYLLSRHLGEYGLHYAPVIASFITALLAVTWILSAVRALPSGSAERTA